MNESHWISYDDLPHSAGGFSRLFLDYLNQFPKVQDYYEIDFRSSQHILSHAEKICQRFHHRAELLEILNDQNQQFGSSERTFENIRKLGEDRTVAIVTGQQVGILTGPLYTIYKTITAIKLAEHLSVSVPDYKFVPVFWLENEDHDFEEVNKVGLLNSENVPAKLEYLLEGKPLDRNIGAVGAVVFDEHIREFFDLVQKTLAPTEFKKPLLDVLQQSCTEGGTFTKAFVSLLNHFFGDSGLVFVSPSDNRVKRLLAPLFRKEIAEYPRLSRLIIEQSAELETNYNAQVKKRALNLFYLHKNGRFLIEPREQDFSLKGTRQYFQKDELLRIADETPELLSANVVLRPICQDTLLPTLMYVGGPSEIAYFAQLKPVYQYFNVPMPVIYPRASATILEAKHEKTLEKYELQLMEFFDKPENVNRKVIETISEVKIDEMFADAAKRIGELASEMKFGLNYIDPTLLGALDTVRSKIDSHLQVLKEKTIEAQKRRHEIALRQIARIANSILPNGKLQERELNITYFMNKHGLDFVKLLMNELQIDKFQHQVIRLG